MRLEIGKKEIGLFSSIREPEDGEREEGERRSVRERRER